MTREMLKEAIADAKTIKETAIANAKSALEEAFTPQLTAMFAERLNELELEEEDTLEDDAMNEMYNEGEDENLEEDFNLEELLAELSKEDNEEKIEKEGMDRESLEEDLMLEDMSDEEIEELVMQVIDDMIASGKLMPGEGEEEGEMEDMDDMDDMDDMGGEEEVEAEEEEIDEDINLEELLAEMDSDKEKETEEVKEGLIDDSETQKLLQQIVDFAAEKGLEISQDVAFMSLAALFPAVLVGSLAIKQINFDKVKDKIINVAKKVKSTTSGLSKLFKEAKTEDKEMEETINELRKELNEVNLLNAKLLYTNKIFKTKNLTESEKIKVLNTFDKAETVKEVKLVFETLTESFKTTTVKKNPIKESLGSASKTISTATPKQPIIEVNDAFTRMQQLAGLRK
jgi:hypothetical protein